MPWAICYVGFCCKFEAWLVKLVFVFSDSAKEVIVFWLIWFHHARSSFKYDWVPSERVCNPQANTCHLLEVILFELRSRTWSVLMLASSLTNLAAPWLLILAWRRSNSSSEQDELVSLLKNETHPGVVICLLFSMLNFFNVELFARAPAISIAPASTIL